ncbi:MAG TPA: phosphoenolpyruvate--protein phosphotransferase [Acidimicrobiales bacterium]
MTVLRGVPTSSGVGFGGIGAGVVVAGDLTPAEAQALDPAAVTAVVTAGGAPLSHASILLRTSGIPAVSGLGGELLGLPPGTVVLVDGDAGTVRVAPSPGELEAARARARDTRRGQDEARALAGDPATTLDGHRVEVLTNVGSPADTRLAVGEGADGVGMLRTEFVFLGRSQPPDEEEQYLAYRAVADALGDRPLVVRTLDLGADVPVWDGPAEPNPALGNRGIRLTLGRPDLLETQLRAIARLASDRPLGVMFPMVTTVDELRRARACLTSAARRAPRASLHVGITVEVPATALTAEVFAPGVDFLAVGTNDLTQYTLAVDRANAAVAALADGMHPAVLRLVRSVTAAADRHGRAVCVVGELASDPLAVPLLLGLGVGSLSVRPNAVPTVKQAVRAAAVEEARAVAEAALHAESAPAVRELAARRWGR